MDAADAASSACGNIPAAMTMNAYPACPACPFCADASQHFDCSGAGTCIDGACDCDPGLTGAVCDIPESLCASGVLSEDGTCCESGVVSAAGVCCATGAVLDAAGECCAVPLVLDACGICQGSGLVVARDGECCGVCCSHHLLDTKPCDHRSLTCEI